MEEREIVKYKGKRYFVCSEYKEFNCIQVNLEPVA